MSPLGQAGTVVPAASEHIAPAAHKPRRSPTKRVNTATLAAVGGDSGGVAHVVPSLPLVELIRQRAYLIYLSRGGQGGDPVSDWLQAEREVLQSYKS